MSRARLVAGAALAAALRLGAGCGSGPPPCGPSTGVVSEVVDGDTVHLATGEKIRYLMVNTTEITKGKNECYGQEAAAYNRSLVLDQQVTLQYDVECQDKYGRLLAYVSVDGRDVSSLLVERGYGCVMHIPPNGDSRADEFNALQAQAKADKVGIWGACDPVPCAQ